MIATRHGNTTVKKGDKLAGTRIIPLVIKKDKLKEASNICEDGPILDIKPFVVRKAAIITTGNEVYHGRIQDAFTPVIEKKWQSLAHGRCFMRCLMMMTKKSQTDAYAR